MRRHYAWSCAAGLCCDECLRVQLSSNSYCKTHGFRHTRDLWLVRITKPGGWARHFAGERGAERLVRTVRPDGSELHYEGKHGSERLVRAVSRENRVLHYQGKHGAERLVRAIDPNGAVNYFEGERGAERPVRSTFSGGQLVEAWLQGLQGFARQVAMPPGLA